MFGLYFGDFLLKKNLIQQAELEKIFFSPYSEFVEKFNAINGTDSDDVAALISEFQKECDLSSDQIDAIKSGDIDKIISAFINFDSARAKEKNLRAYQLDHKLSDEEMDNLRSSGEIESLFPDYIYDDPEYYNRFIHLIIRFLLKTISPKILMKPIFKMREYQFECLAYQQLKGSYHIFLGFSGKGNALLEIANPFGKKEFSEVDEDAYGSVCEMINCINGLYASEMSNENLYLDIDLPGFCSDKKLISNGVIYRLPLVIETEEIDLIISFNTDIVIQ